MKFVIFMYTLIFFHNNINCLLVNANILGSFASKDRILFPGWYVPGGEPSLIIKMGSR